MAGGVTGFVISSWIVLWLVDGDVMGVHTADPQASVGLDTCSWSLSS